MKKVLIVVGLILSTIPSWAVSCTGLSKSLTGKNSDQQNVSLCTVSASGTFVIYEYIVGNNASNAVQSFASWTDDFRSETTGQNSHASPPWLNLASGDNFQYNVAFVRATVGHDLIVDMCVGSANGCTGLTMTGTYDAFFLVEPGTGQ